MLRSTLSSWREYLTPVTHKSTFQITGQITPEEFVEAGDYLCHMFPTWRWNDNQETDKNLNYRDFLPKNKQFLVTRKVPSSVRAEQLVATGLGSRDDTEENEDGWVVEDQAPFQKHQRELSDVSGEDIDEMLEGMEEHDDEEDLVAIAPNNKRYYDLYITYSTSYRVPKIYLVGFNSDGSPLTPEQMFEDISPDYRTKTATIEKLPFFHTSVTSVLIHPCKHANVMRVLMEKVTLVKQRLRREQDPRNKDKEDDWEDLQHDVDDGLRVDQYLVVFLKFITSVTPGIEHDYTMEGW